jgi:hypothetical protein
LKGEKAMPPPGTKGDRCGDSRKLGDAMAGVMRPGVVPP